MTITSTYMTSSSSASPSSSSPSSLYKYSLLLCVILASTLLFASSLQSVTVVHAVDYDLATPYCGSDYAIGKEHSYKRFDDNHPLCLVINNSNKTVFYPQVDRFVLLELDYSWGTLATNETMIHIEIPGWRTPLRYHSSQLQLAAIPFFTLVITLDMGKVAAVQFDIDTDCANCEPHLCLQNMCGVNWDACTNGNVAATTDSTYDCDIKMYVGWLGTDSAGTYLISGGQRMSRFVAYGLRTAYDSASKSATRNFEERV